MKNFFISLAIVILLILPSTVFALNLGGNLLESARDKSGYARASETTLASNLGMVVNVVLSFAGVIFMSLMVYAGYLWMTARGNEQQIDKSLAIIKAAVIGMIITVGSYSITNFIVPKILERVAG